MKLKGFTLAAAFFILTNLLADAQFTISFISPYNGEETTTLTGMNGIFMGNTHSVTTVGLVIHELDINGGGGRWWNGTTFQSTLYTLPATISGNLWSATGLTLPSLNSGQSYALTVTATDTADDIASTNITVQAPITVLNWDPGQTPLGTEVLSNPNNNGGNYWFQISPQTASVGVWRTALNVLGGQASVYLGDGEMPTIYGYSYASANAGSNGFVVDASQFLPGDTWYILVNSTPSSRWNLVTGNAFVYDLGSLATNDLSSTNVSIGAEGMAFFQTTVPTNTLAWQVWLNGATNTLYVEKSFAPDPVNYDLVQPAQMLVVPPYLAAGTFNGFYFVGVPGNPGTPLNLDSRQQPVTSLSFDSFTVANTVVTPGVPGATNFPYVTYQVQVPVQQIAWQLILTPSNGVSDLAVRLASVPNEFNNDAYSDVGGGVGNSISLVPPPAGTGSGVPGLSAGTYYVTVYGTNAFRCGLTNGNPVITPVSYVFSVVNDQPNRDGWRYYSVSDIDSQLGSLGWELLLTNAPPGTEIAIRRNAVPGQWNYRDVNDQYYFNTAGYVDLSSLNNVLQQPGHQADIWYIGVYSPTRDLGNFTLTGEQLAPPLLPFDGSGVAVLNQPAGVWQYFEVVVPSDPNLLGWDLRVTNPAPASLGMYICRDILPPLSPPSQGINYGSTSWPSGYEAIAGEDWTGCAGAPMLEVGMGNPLQPGTYYVGLYDPNNTDSYGLISRGIGLTGYSIPVGSLALPGAVGNPALPSGEADYYQVQIPANTPDWKMHLALTNGEALMMVQQDFLPNSLSAGGYGQVMDGYGGQKMQKPGDQQWALLPDDDNGDTNVTAGTYYVLVAGQGQNPPADCEAPGNASYTLTNWVDGVTELAGGPLPGNNLTYTDSFQPGGTVEFYQFTIPSGVSSIQVTLSNVVANPWMQFNMGPFLVSPASEDYVNYGFYGGTNEVWSGDSLVTIPNPVPGVYNLSIYAADDGSGTFPAAAYTVTVHAVPPTPVAFDGPGNSSTVVNQPAGVWQYFKIVVPSDPNLFGWDLRLTNIVSGQPQMFVSRDILPPSSQSVSGGSASWPSGYGLQAGADWTGCAGGPMIEVGMGNPLQPGTYYIGVHDLNYADSYTLESRGIGLTGYSIPMKTLALPGAVGNPSLPSGEAAYYQVVVPDNTPDWKMHLALTNGEALMMVQQGYLPNSLGGGGYGQVVAGYGGQKMQKPGDQQWALLPPDYYVDTNVVAGTYYVLVAGQGQNPPNDCEAPGNAGYTLTNWVDGVTELTGTLPTTDLIATDPLQRGGTVEFYQFTVPAGVQSMEVTFSNKVANPWLLLNQGPFLVSPASEDYNNYGFYGGTNEQWIDSSLITVPNPPAGTYSLSVYAADDGTGTFPAASYSVRVHAVTPEPLAFDGAGNSTNKVNVPPGVWQYFEIVVPTDTNLLGWDLRLTNVVAGNPQIYVCRDLMPPAAQDVYASQTSWPSGYGAVGGVNWTGCAGYPMLEVGIGNPLQPGTYYVGVQDPNNTNSYSLESRGIGFPSPGPTELPGYGHFSIPVYPLPLPGSVQNSALPAGEAAYYQVIIPSNTPDWKMHLAMTNGEALLMVQQDYLPNTLGGGGYGGVLAGTGGQKMMKPGDQQWALMPDNYDGNTNLTAGTYYVLVASQGENPTNDCQGTNVSDSTLTDWVDVVNELVGTIGAGTQAAYTNSQPGGSVEFYQFTVPPGVPSLQVTLENTVGAPWMNLNTGPFLVNPALEYYDDYGFYGGTNEQWNSEDLITIPNPEPGVYSLSVYASDYGAAPLFPDASYTVVASEPPIPPLSFSPELDTAELNNVVSATLADTASAFYEVTVPATVNGAPVLGWSLGLSETNGTPTLRVRPNLLPDPTTTDTTTFALGSSVIAPPYLTPGTWYVQVIASGTTSFTLTSSAITTNTMARAPWGMPAIGQTTTAPGLSLPMFGDTGVDASGAPLPGGQGVQLAQGQYDFYGVVIPTNNAGLLRVELQALSGTPNLYLRAGAAPTFNHYSAGQEGNVLIDRQLTSTTTEYGNWVPLNGQTATNLTPGLWVLSVFAAGNANASFRLQLSCGDATAGGLVQNLPINGSVTYNNQQLAGGDWRYYLVPIPTNAPINWVVTWTATQGDPQLFVRDTVPPGDGAENYDDYDSDPDQAISWITDDKDQGPYPAFASPGSDTLTTPPLRPASVYYLGFWSPDDATFSVTCATNGGYIDITSILPLYNGTIGGPLAGHGTETWRIDVPATAAAIDFIANNSADVVFSLEQGTVALPGGPAHWVSFGANVNLNQPITGVWPWLPGCSYYLTVTNNSAASELFSLTSNVPLAGPPPGIENISFAADKLVVTGNNGVAGGTYYVLTSPDLTLPLSQWTPVLTNTLGSGGSFNLTIPNLGNGAHPQQYFILQLQ